MHILILIFKFWFKDIWVGQNNKLFSIYEFPEVTDFLSLVGSYICVCCDIGRGDLGFYPSAGAATAAILLPIMA